MAGLTDAWQSQLKQGLGAPPSESMQSTARRLAEPIFLFRRHFQRFYDGFLQPNLTDEATAAQLDPDTAAAFRSATKPKLVVSAFSDSMIVYFPLKDPGSPWFQLKAILGLIAAAGGTSAILAHQGILLRGGIALGCGVEFYEREIYGPVLAEAYELESKKAVVPRVVVGSGLVGFLKEVTEHPPTNWQVRFERQIASQTLKLLTEDGDAWFVDYARQTELVRQFYESSPSFFSDSIVALEDARQRSPENVRSKYDYLIRYLASISTPA